MTVALKASPAVSPNLVEGEYPFTEADFRRIAGMLKEQSGIHLSESKAALVYARLSKRIRQLKLRSFQEYCRLVSERGGEEERGRMLSALTTNLTRFFREPHHFEHLKTAVLEPIAAAVRDGAKLRLWSSACSTGEEPYSMAMTVLSVLPDAARHDVRILATDIDPQVVARAKQGAYRADAVASVAPALRDRWMRRASDADDADWIVGDEVRALVTFNTLNLIADWPMRQRYQAVFCRNVVIYFEEDVQDALWERFRSVLTPDGRLFVGHSERVGDPAFISDALTVYRLKGNAP